MLLKFSKYHWHQVQPIDYHWQEFLEFVSIHREQLVIEQI